MTKTEIKRDFDQEECDYITAIELLQLHCNMSAREAEELVSEWEEQGSK